MNSRILSASVLTCLCISCDQGELPAAPSMFALEVGPMKRFEFSWAEVEGADHYQLMERADPEGSFVQVGDDIVGISVSLTVPLHAVARARYVVRACNAFGCTNSEPLDVTGSLVESIGYFKPSNPGLDDFFGNAIALSSDASTMVIAAYREDSGANGIGGDQSDDSIEQSGAVYVFVRDAQNAWTQQAYVKASNRGWGDYFGSGIALSGDGNTLAVGAMYEASAATGIDGDEGSDAAMAAGAVYVFGRDAQGVWTQRAYVKASNTGAGDVFGVRVALSEDGNTLAVGASGESSGASGVDGNMLDDSLPGAGAVYVFARDAMGEWTQRSYLKASNPGEGDGFGSGLGLSDDGNTLAVGAMGEGSSATGIDGDQADDSLPGAGAVYVFERDSQGAWTQRAYAKASNPAMNDSFGADLALSGDGRTLAAGARGEASNAVGIDGDQTNDAAFRAGAAYVFARDEQGGWAQQAYVKASNTSESDYFGSALALSHDGDMLVVTADDEGSIAVGLEGDQSYDDALMAGAAYVYVRDEQDTWKQRAYVKASNTGSVDGFGRSVALSRDAGTLAVGSTAEASGAAGIGGNQTDESIEGAGAVYLY